MLSVLPHLVGVYVSSSSLYELPFLANKQGLERRHKKI